MAKGKRIRTNRTNYEPRKSTYSLAYEKICELYESENYVPLAVKRVQELFESTSEICFVAGTTLDEALGKLSTWKLIDRYTPQLAVGTS